MRFHDRLLCRPMIGIRPLIGILGAFPEAGTPALATAATAAEPLCNAGSTAPGKPIKPTVALHSGRPANSMNTGGVRGTGMTDIAITASPALPVKITSEQITVDIPQRFARSGTGLGTAYLPEPTYSTLRILEHRTLITFTLCVDANHIEAGTYVGQVIVGGLSGVHRPPSPSRSTKDEARAWRRASGAAGALSVRRFHHMMLHKPAYSHL